MSEEVDGHTALAQRSLLLQTFMVCVLLWLLLVLPGWTRIPEHEPLPSSVIEAYVHQNYACECDFGILDIVVIHPKMK